MKIRYSLALLVAMVFLLSCNNKVKHPVGNDKESARLFVQKFYDWYNNLSNTDSLHKSDTNIDFYTVKHKPQYFDKTLLNAFNKYYDAMPKHADEIVGLDFDPILDAQDIGFDYQTGTVKQIGDKFFIDIHCGLQGKARDTILASPTLIVVEVFKKDGLWKFANFSYPPPEGTGENLLKMLTDSKKEAEEYVASHKAKN
ncbi:MAG: hypothetical protein JSU01_04225 [Bacteroidetes bacterium]|nr:hypothetical protein [Bacteroidota bacterium]